MKIAIKNVVHSPSQSEATEAYTCSVWINGRQAGYAKNSGIGGCSEVRITDPELNTIARENAKALLDTVVPFPYDYSKKATVDDKGYPQYERIKAAERKESTPDGDLVDLVDELFHNYVTIKECRKLKRAVTWLTKDCKQGEFVRISVKPNQLTHELRTKIEKQGDFKQFLFDQDIEDIARIMGHIDENAGPLTLTVSV